MLNVPYTQDGVGGVTSVGVFSEGVFSRPDPSLGDKMSMTRMSEPYQTFWSEIAAAAELLV